MFTTAGYHRRTYAEWLEIDTARAKRLFGDDIDTSENTPMGKFIRLGCEDKRDIEEDAEAIYLSSNYKTASGASLRRLCANANVQVSAGTYARHTVRFTGRAGYEIPAGTGVTTTDRAVSFHTVNKVTIGDDGTVETEVECDTLGSAGNIDPTEITALIRTSAEISGVQGISLVSVGDNADSDATLRKKYEIAKSSEGSGTYTSVLAAIYQLPGVQSVYLEENKTQETVGDLPAKSFRVSVLAPETMKDEIANAMFLQIPLGALDIGDEAVDVTDKWGRVHTIHFSWIKEKMIYVDVKVLINSEWSAASETYAKTLIADYINGLSAHDTVYINNIIAELRDVVGNVSISDVAIGTDKDSLSHANIAAKATEVAKTNESCITIETEETS